MCVKDKIEVVDSLRMKRKRESSSLIISFDLTAIWGHLIHHNFQPSAGVPHANFELPHLQQSIIFDMDELLLEDGMKWLHLK